MPFFKSFFKKKPKQNNFFKEQQENPIRAGNPFEKEPDEMELDNHVDNQEESFNRKAKNYGQ